MMKYPVEFVKIVKDIESMRVRGASEIARKAAEAMKIAATWIEAETPDEFLSQLLEAARKLTSTRPTAVSLPNAVRYVYYRAFKARNLGWDVDKIREEVVKAADEFIKTSVSAVRRIGEIGSKRIEDGDIILTHCNSQAAISVITSAFRNGKSIRVLVTETRPRRQGLITAEQLSSEGIPVTLIVDSAARYFMPEVDKVIVGADAIAANGAVVNKIGTSMIALAAHEARVRFMVAAETYKFSPETLFGELVKIEERPQSEVVPTSWIENHPNVTVRNPAFDITPPEYIDVIITERGIVPPQAFFLIAKEMFGSFLSKDLRI